MAVALLYSHFGEQAKCRDTQKRQKDHSSAAALASMRIHRSRYSSITNTGLTLWKTSASPFLSSLHHQYRT